MTTPEVRDAEVREQVERAVAGPASHLVEQIAERLGGRATAKAVYGDPVEYGGVTVIPVARVGYGFGVGAGQGRRRGGEGRDDEESSGGGGGGGVSATPVGYIEIKDGQATFRPVRDPVTDVLVPGLFVLLGTVGPLVVRRLLNRRR
ncbi:spore germination protein GerW family protein [Actinomadura kijaniata]|uniref:spore germination protein GerW family protein n=1 Tax=Actinomadura kijaniata TaxID=46161 RepID=UPI000A042B7E|nr:spore germination protein GerW family protein [Actinomadura kijaniata]